MTENKPLSLGQIREMAEKEVRIDESNIDKTAMRIPQMHLKYLKMMQNAQMTCVALKQRLDTEYSKKYMYYRNDYTVIMKNKAEIDVMIDGDEDIQKLRAKLELEKAKADYLEAVIKQIGGFSFLIRDIIEWKKFQAGAY